MSQPCAVTKCNRTSRGLCDCCAQNLCLQHLSEHNASLISQLNPLTDEINLLDNRLISIDIKTLTERSRQQLEQIVIEKITKQKNELNFIRIILTKLIEEQEIDLLKKRNSSI